MLLHVHEGTATLLQQIPAQAARVERLSDRPVAAEFCVSAL